MNLTHVGDDEKVEGSRLADALIRQDDPDRAAAIVDAGSQYGVRRQAGDSHGTALAGLRVVLEQWARGETPGNDPRQRMHIGDDVKVELAHAAAPIIQAREGADVSAALFDLGTQFGQVVQATGSIPFAFSHAGDLLVAWYGVERPFPQVAEPEQPGPTPVDPVPQPGSPLEALRVQGDRRWLNVDVRGTTAFGLAGKARTQGHQSIIPFLEEMKRQRFNVLHIILTLTGDYWAPCAMGPHLPGFWEATDFTINAAADRGLYSQLIIFGGLDAFGAHWDPATRRDEFSGDIQARAEAFAHEVVRRYAKHDAVAFNLWNEPDQTSAKHSFGKLVTLGRSLKREAPDRLFTFGSPSSEDILTLLADGADIHSSHLTRLLFDGQQISWVTTKRSGDDLSIDQTKMPYWHDEDWNRGEGPQHYGRPFRNDFDESPASAFCAAAHSRARQHLLSFHWDGGLFGDMPGPKTVACMEAFHRGLDAFPRTTGHKWRGHHAESFVRSAPFASVDDPRGVHDHVRRGNLWRAVGVGDRCATICEHPNFNLLNFGAGRVVDRVVHGEYAAGVYARS